jgi:hypothetical protein
MTLDLPPGPGGPIRISHEHWRKAGLVLGLAFLTLASRAGVTGTNAAEATALPSQHGLQNPRTAPDPESVPEGLARSDWRGIREAHAAWQHEMRPQGDDYSARSPGHRWQSRFDQRGFTTTPDGGGWIWGLELWRYGFPGHERSAAAQPEPRMAAAGHRLTRQWDPCLEEWYVNDARGLEHGFTLAQRPPGAHPGHPLLIDLAVRGTLRLAPHPDGQAATFVNPDGDPALTYDGLKVWDATGATLPARLVSGPAGALRYEIEESTATYPVTIDPIAHPVYLKASNTPPPVVVGSTPDFFGVSVAVSGDIVVVGAHYEDGGGTGVDPPSDEQARDAGAAYIFARRNGVWKQEAYLKASNTDPTDYFGISVAVSGETVVVGAQHEKGSGTGVNPPDDDALFFAGAAYVFVRQGETWSQQAYLKASDASFEDLFGSSVAIAGDTLVVGARVAEAAYVFEREANVWRQTAILKAFNNDAGDEFGGSVAISGDLIVVGAPWEDGSGRGINPTVDELAIGAGAAYVFAKLAGQWIPQVYLKASNAATAHNFGGRVDVSGETVVVGANAEAGTGRGVNPPQTQGIRYTGAVYVFRRIGEQWIQEAYLKAANADQDDHFGSSVALEGDTLLVGAIGERGSGIGVNPGDDNAADRSGAVYVFWRDDDEWSQVHYLKASNTEAFDGFGHAVALSGDLAIVSATGEDGAGTGVNPPNNNDSSGSGAAYLFAGLASVGRSEPDTAPRLTWRPDRTLTISHRGEPGQTYLIQRGGDLDQWPTVATVLADPNGVISWIDPSPPSVGPVFYRVTTP